MPRLLKNTRGATLVEFSIILMLFLTLVFGVIEFSLFLFNKQVITNACREGARVGIIMRTSMPVPRDVDEENGIISARVIAFAKDHLVSFGENTFSLNDIKVLPEDRNLIGTTFGRELVVEASFKYNFLFLGFLIDPVDIKSISRMRME